MKKSYFAILSLFILILYSSCQDSDSGTGINKEIVGTWHQTSRYIDGNQAIKDSSRLLMKIQENNICLLYDSTKAALAANDTISRSGWDYSGGTFNLAIDLPVSWKVDCDNNNLSLESSSFKSDGSISKTTLNFQRVATK